MKNTLMFVVLVVFLAITASSQVVVLQDGKTTSYQRGSEVTISGKTTARVLYDGVLITIPKGQKVQVKRKGNKVFISGNNLKDIEIVGRSLSSKGPAIVSVSLDTMKIVDVKGDVFVDENGLVMSRISKNNKVSKTNKTSVKSKTSKMSNQQKADSSISNANDEEAFPEVSDYVNELATEQAAQDIERPDMSQSTTTGA